MSAHPTFRSSVRRATTLALAGVLGAAALVTGGVSAPASAADTEVQVPGSYVSGLRVESDAREADHPKFLPVSSTELALRIPVDELNLDTVSYRLFGDDFQVAGVVDLSTDIIEIPLPADFFDVSPGHSPIPGENGESFYGVALEATGPSDAPHPADDDRSGDTFRADLVYQRDDTGTSPRAFFDLTRAHVDGYIGSALRRVPERITVRSGNSITLTADSDYFWVVAHPSPLFNRWGIDNALSGLHELDTSISNNGRSLTLTVPYADEWLRYGDQDLVVTRRQGYEGYGDVEDIVIPVHLLQPTAASAPTVGSVAPGDSSATIRWQAPASDGGALITGYEVRAFARGALVRTVTVAGDATSAVVDGLTNGTPHTFDVAAVNSEGTGAFSPRSNPVVPIGDETSSVTRVAGADRFDAAVNISKEAYPDGAQVAYVATGLDYPDALSAGAAAAKQGGPLLLSAGASLPEVVRAELARLGLKKIVVVGGPNAVSESVLASLKDIVPNTVRVTGADRFETSRNTVRYAFSGADPETAYLATGADFPDALSAGGAAGAHGSPVLLVDGRQSAVDSETTGLLNDLGVDSVKIAGGPVSVSAGIEAQLVRSFVTTRLSGADRFETAQAINRDAFTSAGAVFLATGSNFPDALAGSAWAGSVGAPLYVIPSHCVPQGVLDAIASLRPDRVTLLGGPSALAPAVDRLTACAD